MCLLCWAKLRRVMNTIHATLPRTSFLLIYTTVSGTCPGSRYCTCNGVYLPLVSYSRIPSRLYWRSWAHRQTGLSVIFPFSLVCVSSGDILWDGHTHSRVHPRHTRRAPMIRLSFTRACVHSTLAIHSTSIGVSVSQRHHFLELGCPVFTVTKRIAGGGGKGDI